MKKTKKVLFFIALAILLIAGVTTYLIKKQTKKEEENSIMLVLPNHAEYVQTLSGYVRCINLAEMSGIDVEQNVEDEISEFAHLLYSILDETEYDNVSLTELMHLLYIYSYYDFDCSAVLEELEGHYIQEEKLFNSYWYSGETSKTPGYVYFNIEMYRNFGDIANGIIKKYEIETGLVDWFNSTLPDIDVANEDMSNYFDMLYSSYGRESIALLNYEKLTDDLSMYLDEITNNIDQYKATVYDVSCLEEGVIFSSYLSGNSDDYMKKANELYNSISSLEGFGYDIEDDSSILVTSYYLRDHYVVCGTVYNDYLNENISAMIKNHFDRYCKGKIE